MYSQEPLKHQNQHHPPTLTNEPTDNRDNDRDLSQEEEEEEVEDRELQLDRDDDGPDVGVIVQKIFITSNQRLPLGPKAI